MDKLFYFWKEDIDLIPKKHGVKIILEQDGTSFHRSKSNIYLLNKFFTKNGWIQNPLNSPDLAFPLEDLFEL